MLNLVRNSVNNIFMKLILVGAAIAFAISGAGIGGGGGNTELVYFHNLKPITIEQFYRERKDTIRQLQNQYGDHFTPELIEQINLKEQILERMIRNRLISAWITETGIEVDNKLIAQQLRENPSFNNEDGKFDIKLFKRFLSNISVREDEFFEKVKFGIGEKMLHDTYSKSVYTPNIFNDIILGYLSEVKSIDLIKASLKNQKKIDAPKLSDQNLINFYDSTKDNYIVAETRKINYMIIDDTMVEVVTDVTEDEARKYYDEHPEQFPDSIFKKEKEAILRDLKKQKKEKALEAQSRNFEDFVASGETIQEIAKMMKYKLKSFNGNFEKFKTEPILKEIATQIFSMEEGEVSYPMDLMDGRLLIVEISSINKSYYPDYDKVKGKLKKAYTAKQYKQNNLKKLEEIRSKLTPQDFRIYARNSPYNFLKKKISRSGSNGKISPKLIEAVLNAKKNNVSEIIIDGDNAYIFNVTSSIIDDKMKKKLKSSESSKIDDYFKAGYMDEIISYYYKQNNPQINQSLFNSIK